MNESCSISEHYDIATNLVKIWALKIFLHIEILKKRTTTFVYVQAEWNEIFLLLGFNV